MRERASDALSGWLPWEGVEAPEDQRTSTSSDLKDLDDARAYVVLPRLGGYCDRCDLLVGLDGLHVTGVDRDGQRRGLRSRWSRRRRSMGCLACGVVARGHGRDEVELVDAPAFGRPVRIRWRKRRWVCPDAGCPVGLVHRAGRGHRGAAGEADSSGVPVGDRADPA